MRWKVVVLIPVGIAVAVGLFSGLRSGREFFPKTDAGLLRLFVRIPSGIRVEDIEDPLMREIRYLDKLIDELAKGRPMDKILRK